MYVPDVVQKPVWRSNFGKYSNSKAKRENTKEPTKWKRRQRNREMKEEKDKSELI